MKKILFQKPMPFLGLLAFIILFGTSCQKSEVTPGSGEYRKEQEIKAARMMVKRLPKLTIYDDKTRKSVRITTDGFSFTDNTDGGGFNFSDPNGLTYTNNETGGQFIVAAQGFGSNSGGGGAGGLIQIGGTSLNVKYTYCFSADDTFFGADLFSDGGGDDLFDGVSGVIGVDGDFSQIQDDGQGGEDDFEDLFSGFGMYIVYDDRAQGTYPILNWTRLVLNSDDELDTDDLRNKGFAFFIDFENETIYFSYNGNLSVSGGSMTFTGKYMAVKMEDEDDPDVQIVDGLGTMGCN